MRVNEKGCRTDLEMIKVWAHGCLRVFSDRLVNKEDQTFFYTELQTIMKENFKYVRFIFLILGMVWNCDLGAFDLG